MPDITGFTISPTTSDWDAAGNGANTSIEIRGTYTGGGTSSSGNGSSPTNDEDIRLQVQLDDGSWTTLTGTWSWTFGNSSKSFSLQVDSASLARFTNGTAINDLGNATFRFLDDDGSPTLVNVSGSGDLDANGQTYTHAIATPGINSFTVNQSTSELNPAGGITLKGTFTGGGTSADNQGDIVVMVREVGTNTWLELSGTFTWNFTTKSYTFVTTDPDLNQYTLNKHVEFRFVDDNGTDNTNNDVVLTTTPSITLCFYPGTMIATPEGEKAVETLAIGDMVLRQDGSAVPVRWMGRNTISLLFADKMKTLPIRIRKDALAENVPSRDLLVSPDHAIFVDGILAQAGTLVNGRSIVRETNVPSTFTYLHIELAQHALVMAENAPAESFIDNVDRMAYDNWAEHEALYGDMPALIEMDLPRAKSQRQLPVAVRQRIDERAVELGYTAIAAA